MAKITWDSDDQSTEDVPLAYKDAQYLTRGQIGVIFGACNEALAKNTALAERLGEGGDLESMAEYHTAKAAQLGGGEAVLVKAIEDLVAMIQGMQNAMPEGMTLFPGVPRT
jgi:hypothetical protein